MNKAEQYPLVSIAVCTYNGEKFLKEQLDSLVNQTYPNLEINVFDDCSNDRTWEILKEYADKYDFFNAYKNPKNLGYVKNFEKAITSSNGEYIALSDQDDVWDLDKIQIQIEAIGDHLLLYHDSELIEDNGKEVGKHMSDIINLYHGDQPEAFVLHNCVSGHSCLIKRELLPHILPFKEGFFHDHWMAYVAANVGSIGYVDKSLVKYRQHRDTNTDILGKRLKKNKGYHENRDVKRLHRELKWLKRCAEYPNNKNPKFINKLTHLFEERMNAFVSFGYASFLFKHRDLILYMQKRSVSSKNSFIYKQIWGLKAKLLWGKIFDVKSFILRSF